MPHMNLPGTRPHPSKRISRERIHVRTRFATHEEDLPNDQKSPRCFAS